MKKALLSRCGGKLTLQEATDGMNAAIKNALRLLNDAEILIKHERYATALSLSILAIEEAGKITILRQMLTCEDGEEDRIWKSYRNHRAKNVMWILPSLAAQGAKSLIELREAANPSGEHTKLLDLIKQLGFYTDFVGNRNWSQPDHVADKNLTESIFSIANIVCRKRNITTQENEAWIKHLGKQSIHGMNKLGLKEYFKELMESGLIEKEEINIQSFLHELSEKPENC
ncbi:AbiV family abortive infection protein [Nisaea sp.]|uniref:AbiV family abortive infection protein n=1 Tax=Nisaea sp. TaxID=2024842 RepID=UPI0032971D35